MGINGFTCAIASIFRSTICTIKQRIYCLFCFLWQWIYFLPTSRQFGAEAEKLYSASSTSQKYLTDILTFGWPTYFQSHLFWRYQVRFIVLFTWNRLLNVLPVSAFMVQYYWYCCIAIAANKMSSTSTCSSWHSWPQTKFSTDVIIRRLERVWDLG